MARVDQTVLARLGDSWCDLMAEGAAQTGAATIIANFARAVADCNRSEAEMSPDEVAPELKVQYTAPGRKERAGLGVVPTRLAPHGPLWVKAIDRVEMEARLDTLHRPYHAAIAAALDGACAQHGWALLIDLHSMPPIPVGQRGYGAKVVIGDDFGGACEGWMTALAQQHALAMTAPVSMNQPYAGGHIIRRHGDRKRQIYALQIELDRRLYLDLLGQPVLAQVAAWSDWLTRLTAAIVDQKARDDMDGMAALAAE